MCANHVNLKRKALRGLSHIYVMERHKIIPAVFLIFEREGKILMARRANTGYMDGKLQMPSGHVEKGELPTETGVREAKEEVGVDIAPEDLILVHTSYRARIDDANERADYFFRVEKWSGELCNTEEEKCSELIWMSFDDIHEDTVPVIVKVLQHIRKGTSYSEMRD